MYLHVRWTGEDVGHCPGDVLRYTEVLEDVRKCLSDLRLKAGHAVVDSGHLVWTLRVHSGLELGLDQACNQNSDTVYMVPCVPGDIPQTRMFPPMSLSSCRHPSKRPVTANFDAA